MYFALAGLGGVFPSAASKSGWAWAGCGDEVEANALANFVGQTLARIAAEEAERAAAGQLQDTVVEMDSLAARIR